MKLFIPLLLCFFSFNVSAALQGITDEGDVVVLNSDGTWFYAEDKPIEEFEISNNPGVFKTPASANFVLKSKKNNATFAFNTKQWVFEKSTTDDSAIEYALTLKAGDLYARVITERIQINNKELTEIALDNAKNVAPNAKVIKKEYRMVNGKKMIYMEMVGTMKGIEFQYLGYYYSDASGSTQYVTFTGASLVEKYRAEIDDLLNGFAIAESKESK
ncbi:MULTISPECIES: hypothetical protein [Psychromonas]|uniref:hypothetical protein n=1 Tax=Psychromonas TaxID=67572 RepID=UPI000406F00B|nr:MULTISPECIES: hypothetical protein [Psychromonas]MBB1272366.1 hypothetical protein [Psychromonas sp. SR45-3]